MSMDWKPIEKVGDVHIWVLKYNMWQLDGRFVDPYTPGAEKFTSCHGFYSSFEEAKAVRDHFPDPTRYSIERVVQRILL